MLCLPPDNTSSKCRCTSVQPVRRTDEKRAESSLFHDQGELSPQERVEGLNNAGDRTIRQRWNQKKAAASTLQNVAADITPGLALLADHLVVLIIRPRLFSGRLFNHLRISHVFRLTSPKLR